MKKNMRKLRNRMIVIAMLLAMTAALTACQKNQGSTNTPSTTAEIDTQDSAGAEQKEGTSSSSKDASSKENTQESESGTILENEGELEITVPEEQETYGE